MQTRNKQRKNYTLLPSTCVWLKQFHCQSEIIDLLVEYAIIEKLTKEKIESSIKSKINPQVIEKIKQLKKEETLNNYSKDWSLIELIKIYPDLSLAELKEYARIFGYSSRWAFSCWILLQKIQKYSRLDE